MPTGARRARERASTRERIIEAALHVLESEGPSALTMRRIATDVEYTAPVVYQHFANKDALVLELVAHGHRLMMAELGQAAGEPDIDRRMMQLASEYVRFAGEHPYLYQVMNGNAVDAEERRRAAAPAIAVLKELLSTWSDTHAVVLADFDEACDIIWGTLYGMASLGALGHERARRLAQQALRTLLLGWRTGLPSSV
ncbi:TetR/AcrR family transcriptional regulator [Paractinoplanes atraurantiacus]|uniref:DNA-binding transcriptional regulator, AcrR family n=1 Tax=Paractinoplanes atraurantiacus TaxID=1036182 RepID=A0A285GM16_9ACTN|nr:TetR/AcrR family transcriptional regulator [Actinoplanes atraurantiacus]SNY24617.1 DNA-binding transcriptional regulator, AcrR family [Actinoplanes atraurantiacus]